MKISPASKTNEPVPPQGADGSERHRMLDVVGAVDGDARDADCARDLLAVAAQLVEAPGGSNCSVSCSPPSTSADSASRRDAERARASASATFIARRCCRGCSSDKRNSSRRRPLLVDHKVAVGDVVDLPGDAQIAAIARRFSRGSTRVIRDAKFFASRRVMRSTSRTVDRHRTSTNAASRASPRDGFGRCVKTSQSADSERLERREPRRGARTIRRRGRAVRRRARGAARRRRAGPDAPPRLEPEQRAQLVARPVERRLAEGPCFFRRQITSAELEGRAERPAGSSRAAVRCRPSSLAATSSGSSRRRSTPSTRRPHGSAECTQ